MIGEVDIYGVYLPTLLVLMLLSYGISVPMRKLLGRTGLYRFVWHRALFDLSLYVILLGLAVLISYWLHL
ncbi:MAG: DUF1656 domain-containing protein [Janthinobacterium lividum]